MSAGPNASVRFAAGSLQGTHGTIWTLWTGPRGDVYVGGNGTTGDIKISLHASGDWRHEFSREHYREPAPFAPSKRRRAFIKWRRPAEFSPGYTRAFQILVPDEHIVAPRDAAVHDLDVCWAPSPGLGREVYFTGILGPQDSEGWPIVMRPGARLVHQEDLGNGERLWLVWHSETMGPERLRALAELTSVLREQLADAPPEHLANPAHRIFGMGVEDGTGLYVDLSVPVIFGKLA